MKEDVETDCINAIRFLAVDAVNKANSGHGPSGSMNFLLISETGRIRFRGVRFQTHFSS